MFAPPASCTPGPPSGLLLYKRTCSAGQPGTLCLLGISCLMPQPLTNTVATDDRSQVGNYCGRVAESRLSELPLGFWVQGSARPGQKYAACCTSKGTQSRLEASFSSIIYC